MNKEYLKAVGDRIKGVRLHQHFSQKDFADKLDLPSPKLSKIESGVMPPGHEFLIKIATRFNANLNYILLGVGDMFMTGHFKKRNVEENGIPRVNIFDDLVWLCENSPVFRNNIMGYAGKFWYENEEMIKREIALNQESHPDSQ